MSVTYKQSKKTTIYPPGYYQSTNGLIVTVHHVPKCISYHEAIGRLVITGMANCLSFWLHIYLIFLFFYISDLHKHNTKTKSKLNKRTKKPYLIYGDHTGKTKKSLTRSFKKEKVFAWHKSDALAAKLFGSIKYETIKMTCHLMGQESIEARERM